MKKFYFNTNEVYCFKLNNKAIEYLKNKNSKSIYEGNKIKCKAYELIPIFNEFCIKNPGVEPLYKFEYVQVEVCLSHFGIEFLKNKKHSFKIKEEKYRKAVINSSFNELARVFGEYYDENYYSIYDPFLYNEIIFIINK